MKRGPIAKIKIKLKAYIFSFGQVENPNKFVIYGQGRTGSSLLRDLLNSHPEISCAFELFHRWRSLFDGKAWFPYRYLKGIEAQSHQYVFGFKVKIYQLIKVQKLDPEDFLNRLEARGYQIIYLRRNNLLDHALSGIIRRRRQSPYLKKNDSYQDKPFRVSIEDLEEELKYRAESQEMELKYLEGRKYFEVNYEKNLSNAKKINRTTKLQFDKIIRRSVY